MTNVDFFALPTWRKLTAIAGLAAFFLLGFTVTIEEMNIWSLASKTPNSATGQLYELHWMHGSVRYVTATDQSKFRFWYSNITPLIGIPCLIAFFSMISLGDLLRAGRDA